ncbi:hypothetical protein ACFHW2_29445 [Actinomadura sp. LOL_016]|uniref:hypothetical protein n=1 Tax=unclassified Actinomadura TaxID=2626254 RepID=UPI003A7FDDBA
MEARILDHWAEPVLDLPGQSHEAWRVLLTGKPDDHPCSVAVVEAEGMGVSSESSGLVLGR